MKTDEEKQSDRAVEVFTGSIPDGEYNRDVEVAADSYGLIIDDYVRVPWEWIISRMQNNRPGEITVARGGAEKRK